MIVLVISPTAVRLNNILECRLAEIVDQG